MSARPFMQLYVSDYLGDTMHLTCEQHGAYILLLMSMWQAGGTLPNDRRKLARICRMTPAKFKGVSAEVLPYFTESGAHLTHARLSKELQKANEKHAKRVRAGSKGGRAKSLKNNEPPPSNAKAKPKQLPETRNQIYTTVTSARDKTIPHRIGEALGVGVDFRKSCWHVMTEPLGWITGQNGCDLELDLLPTLKALSDNAPPSKIKAWGYFRDAVFESRDRRINAPANPAPTERKENDLSDRNRSTAEQRNDKRSADLDEATRLAIRAAQRAAPY